MGTFVTAGAAPPVFVDATPPQGLPGEFDASHVNDIWGALVDVRTHSSGFINVKSYGATGNGSTDDTTAIQAAATAAAGKTLRFPQGSYKISARINLSSSTTVQADSGVTITQITQGEIVFYGSGVSGVTIRGFTLVGPGSVYRPLIAGDTAGAITFDASGGGHIVERCTVSGFFNGIAGTFLTGFTVRECDVSAWRIYGILASRTNDFHINHNRVHGNDMAAATAWSAATTYGLGDTATASGFMWMSLHAANLNNTPPASGITDTHWLQLATYCVMATGGRGAAVSPSVMSRNSISFNELRDNPTWDGIMSHDCDGLRIVGNDIRNVRMGMDLGPNPTVTGTNYVEKLVIQGNYVEGTSTDMWGGAAANNRGISVSGLDGTTTFSRNVSITGNVVSGFGTFNPGVSLQGGIILPYSTGVSIGGNRVSGIGPNSFSASSVAGIGLNQNCGNCAIQGNTIATDISVAAGIVVLNATIAGGVTISGNSILTGNVIPPILVSTASGDLLSITGNTLKDGSNGATGVRVSAATLTQINVAGNASSCATMYRATGCTFTREYVDWIKQVPLTILGTSNLTNLTPTITTGFGAPTSDEPIGSVYLNGSTGTNLYIKTATGGAGWTAK
jgi:hypothetical protein